MGYERNPIVHQKRSLYQRERFLLNIKLAVGDQWYHIAHLPQKEQVSRVQTAIIQAYPHEYGKENGMNRAHRDALRIVSDIRNFHEKKVDPFKGFDED